MKRPVWPMALVAAFAVVALEAFPSHAHGVVSGGPVAGLVHPLLGLDHLLMLLAVGTAASQISFQLLGWALGGGLLGAVAGLFAWNLPSAEALASLAVALVAGMVVVRGHAGGWRSTAVQRLSGAVVGLGLAIHGLLHGLEAPTGAAALSWWSGALITSVVVCAGSAILLRRLPQRWGTVMAMAMVVAGGLLAVHA